MTKFLSFSAEQASILNEAFQQHPKKLERDWKQLLDNTDAQQLAILLKEFEAERSEMQRRVVALPPENTLHFYVVSRELVIGSSFSTSSDKGANYDDVDGKTKHLNHVGDIERYLVSALRNLTETIVVLDQIIDECQRRISEYEAELRNPFHGKENQAPYKQIRGLPLEEDRQYEIALVFERKSGLIDLSMYKKRVACRIVWCLDQCMLIEGVQLRSEDKVNIQIKWLHGEFNWIKRSTIRKKGVKQDKNVPVNVVNKERGEEVGLPPEIEKWVNRFNLSFE